MAELIIFVVVLGIGMVLKQISKNSPAAQARRQAMRARAQQRIQARLQAQGISLPPNFVGPPGQPAQPGRLPPAQFVAQSVPPPPVTSSQPQARSLPPHSVPPRRGKADVDLEAKELMLAGNEVAAVRLLCDEAGLGIVEAQEYARRLAATETRSDQPSRATVAYRAAPGPARDEPEYDAAQRSEAFEQDRYVGSAAIATSIFERSPDENEWASGWVDTPEPEDRSDIDELWRTVREATAPGRVPPQPERER